MSARSSVERRRVLETSTACVAAVAFGAPAAFADTTVASSAIRATKGGVKYVVTKEGGCPARRSGATPYGAILSLSLSAEIYSERKENPSLLSANEPLGGATVLFAGAAQAADPSGLLGSSSVSFFCFNNYG